MAKEAASMKDLKAKEKASKLDRRKSVASVPSTPERLGKDFEIDIFRGWCKACGICAAFCPRNCIETDEEGSPLVKDANRCTGCGWCEVHCPDFAISVRPRNAKAVRAGED
jgi:2-oxoglutarate ferredoxin oxidoreductase subunit delta